MKLQGKNVEIGCMQRPHKPRGYRFPRSVQELIEVLGQERALFLIGRLPRAIDKGHPSGQVILYVPKSLRPDHPLVEILGWADAEKLVRVFGGEILEPANCRDLYRRYRDDMIRAFIRAGGKVKSISELMRVSERHVRNLAREIPQEEIQRDDN